MRYRSRAEIIARILEAADGNGSSKTKIMYRVMLSYPQIKEYLRTLLDSGLIEKVRDSNAFKTTQKGIQFLEINEKVQKMLQSNNLSAKS
jgi:predicted transcriptional regulator